MPNPLYTSLSKTAENLVAKFGKTITISRDNVVSFDPATGIETLGAQLTQTVYAVSLPASGGKIEALDQRFKREGREYEVYGFLIVAGNDLSFEPLPGDSVTLDSASWGVIGVTPTRPNDGTGIKYDIAIRKD